MAPESFLAQQAQVVQALADGVVLALRWLRTAGPTDLFKQLPTPTWMGDRSIYLGAFDKLREAYAHTGQIQPAAVANAWRAHARLSPRLRQQRLVLTRTYDPGFVARANVRTPV
jgi:NitT/TauT family transport system substrate-binding protein